MHHSAEFQLRVFHHDDSVPVRVESQTSIPNEFKNIAQNLEALSGWKLSYTNHRSKSKSTGGRFSIEDMSLAVTKDSPALSRPKCEAIAQDLTQLADEIQTLRNDQKINNAEIAVLQVGRVAKTDAVRLDALFTRLLETAIDLVGFESAAICVLDKTAGALSFRSCLGSHFEPKLGDSRLIQHCKADLEAMAGNLVTLNKKSDVVVWHTPVACHSAICIPISSLDNLIGTLWIVSDRRKIVSDSYCNLLEIIAGRFASELERVAIVSQLTEMRQLEVAEPVVEVSQHECAVQPPFTDWSIDSNHVYFGADKSEGPRSIWRVNRDDQLAIMAYDFRGNHAFGQQHRLLTAFEHLVHASVGPEKMIAALRDILGHYFDSIELESLACMLVDPSTGELRFDLFGEFMVSHLSSQKSKQRNLHPADLILTTQTKELFLPRQSKLILHHPIYDLDEFQIVLERRTSTSNG